MSYSIWFFFVKQKTAYEMRISDWSSDVCSSDLRSSDAVEQSIGAPLASIRVLLHELQDGCYLNAGEFNTQGLMFVVEFIAGRTVEQKAALKIGRASCRERVCQYV